MKTLQATVRSTGEGERRWFCGGGLHTWKATPKDTGGAFLLFEDSLDRGKMTPLHRHPDADETFYMLAGDILVHIDGSQWPLSAGGIAVIPRGIPHAFKVTSGEARMLCLQTPGNGEAFYRRASDLVTEGSTATPIDSTGCVKRPTRPAQLRFSVSHHSPTSCGSAIWLDWLPWASYTQS